MNFFFIKTVLSIKIYHQSIKIKRYNGIINSINYRGSFWINLSKESSIDPLLLLFLIPSDTHLISIRSLTILTSERILLEMKNCPMFLLTIFFGVFSYSAIFWRNPLFPLNNCDSSPSVGLCFSPVFHYFICKQLFSFISRHFIS